MKIPIVYVISENFVVPALVSAISAIQNNSLKLEFHFLITGIIMLKKLVLKMIF